ncbi:integrase core domain-containing protein, partial [Pseudonocardia benzenivorans]
PRQASSIQQLDEHRSIERFFGTVKYEHLYRAIIGDGNAVEINCFRQTYNALRPHQALDDRTPRQAYLTGLEST